MNVEENRLLTFVNWPADAPISPDRIAKGGFWATGAPGVTKCFACGCYIANWFYGDQVMARHRELNAQCPFVLNPGASGNIPITPPPQSITPSTSNFENFQVPQPQSLRLITKDFSQEANRLATFEKWPTMSPVSAASLSKAGFYYLQDGDRVKCFKCQGICAKWEPGDDPIEEHKRFFPNCEFMLNMAGEPNSTTISTFANKQVISRSNCQELGVQIHKQPHQSKYATIESRIRTFHGWPDELVQTPEILAEAGFYYMGSTDAVRCFHCDGGLNRWDPQDEPWREHAKHFPTCGFLLLSKGVNFIKKCAESSHSTESLVDGTGTVRRTSGTMVFDRIRPVSDQELQQLMDSPEAMAALGIGLHVGRVKQAIKIKIETTGSPFTSADALIEAALNVQSHETSNYDSILEEQEPNIILSEVCRAITQRSTEVQSDAIPETKPASPPMEVEEVIPNAEVNAAPISLEEENRRLKEARLCKICLDTEVGVVFLPCGHLATCVNCAPSLKDCPVCRSSIQACVRTFLSYYIFFFKRKRRIE